MAARRGGLQLTSAETYIVSRIMASRMSSSGSNVSKSVLESSLYLRPLYDTPPPAPVCILGSA